MYVWLEIRSGRFHDGDIAAETTLFVVIGIELDMARLQNTSIGDSGSRNGRSSSSSKPFTQRVRVVEHASVPASSFRAGDPMTSHRRRVGQTAAGEDDRITQNHFERNSEAIEQRARADLKDSLVWVTRLSEKAVDRPVLREAVSRDFYLAGN